jgi:spore coat protein H
MDAQMQHNKPWWRPIGLMAAVVWTVACGSETPPATADVTLADSGDTASGTDAAGQSDTIATTDTAAGSDTAAPDSGPDGTDLSWPDRYAEVIPQLGVLDLRITFAPGDWVKLLADWTNLQVKTEFPATIQYGKYLQTGAGVRLKGLSSLTLPAGGTADPTDKYPLKIDFNAFGGQRLLGIDEVGLNGASHDPSHMRDWLTAAMYQSMGLHAVHLGYANVHIDDVWIGLYGLSQSVDKQFLKERFGEAGGADDGNLYKCVYNGFGACMLGWLGPNKSDYVRAEGCAEGYDTCGMVLQTNEDDPKQNDYSDLLQLIAVLNNTPLEDLPAELPKVFAVDQFLKLAAVAAATANLDSYFGKGNNFYLYHRADGRFEMIPWDFDMTYGSGCENDLADPTCGGLDSHPLAGRILAVPQWRAQYLQHLCTLSQQWMTVQTHKAWIAGLDSRIGELARTEPNPSSQGSYQDQTSEATVGENYGNLLDFVGKRQKYLAGACSVK